jgi:diguanylate cyclase (GGDEF)-like protein/PAS domain S-box-containing protein
MSKPVTILIVDDELQNRRLLETQLRPEGYVTVSVASGEEALALVAQRAPDLILLDVMMPGMDGFEVASRLKTDPATSNIPIIMVTASVGREARVAGLNAGAEEFLMKPVDRAELWLRIRNLLRLKSYGDFLRNHTLILEQQVQSRTADLQRFRAAMQVSGDAIVLIHRDSMRYIDVNQTLCDLVGRSRQDLLDMAPTDLFCASRAILERDYDSLIADNNSSANKVEGHYRHRNGSLIPIETRRRALHTDSGWIIVGSARDTTERNAAEAKIRRLNRVYAMLSGINSAIVRIRNRDELFSEVCRIAVAEGRFLLARVVAQAEDGQARIAATTEADAGLFQWIVDQYNNDPVHSPSLLALGLRDAQPVISNDVASDPRIPNRAALTKNGSYAVALLPLVIETRIVGSLILRAPETGVFDEQELSLLLELTGNVALALDRIGKEEKLALFDAERKRSEEVSRRFSSAMDATADAIYLVDRASMRFVHVNEAACRMQNRSREELMALGPIGLLAVPRAELEATYDSIIAAGVEAKPLEMQRSRGDGPQVWVELRRHAQRSGDSWVIVTLVRDVTERKAAEEKIRRLNRVYAVLSSINMLIVRVRSRDDLFEEACRIAVEHGAFQMAWIGTVEVQARRLKIAARHGGDQAYAERIPLGLDDADSGSFGHAGRTVLTMKPVVIQDVEHDPRTILREEAARRGIRSMAVLPLMNSGAVAGVLALYANDIGFFDEEEMKLLTELAGNIAFAIDHLDRQDQLDYLAYYDVLTGLANRTLFLERVAQYMRSAASGGHRLAVFLVDLERFKNINDSLGQAAGDTLLRQVADWLTRRAGDASLVARIGSDHFALVLPEVKDGGGVAHLVEKALTAFMEHPFRLEDAVLRVAAKVGVALYPDDGVDADGLLKCAEAALKNAKASGDKILLYTQKMTERAAGKLTLENQLRRALDNGEFVLHYQPKVSLADGRVTGAEALIRWNDPKTGLVPPGRFIPILEETGLIYEVGRWALREAIAEYLRWRNAGLAALRIAVNISPMQLRNRGFIAEIENVLGADSAAASGLELEITESLIMEDVKHSVDSLRAIRTMGVPIAIDDFGTGFSSLSHLARLPVDTLKIDRSFVVDMTLGPDGLALVSTIINLAHSLKLKVVAEGVETDEQSRLLRLLNCDEMQGFLFSKPVPAKLFQQRFLAPPGPSNNALATNPRFMRDPVEA